MEERKIIIKNFDLNNLRPHGKRKIYGCESGSDKDFAEPWFKSEASAVLHATFKGIEYNGINKFISEKEYDDMGDDAIRFFVVGMKFHGNHIFTNEDNGKISLEKEDDNPYDNNAIKVLVNKKHVAYVAKEYAAELRKISDLEHKTVEYQKSFPNSAILTMIA